MGEEQEPTEPAPIVRVLLESVARALDVDRGRWTCELVFEDGQLVKLWRKEGPVLRGDLDERFGPSLA